MEGHLTGRRGACSGNITSLYWRVAEAMPRFYSFSRQPEFPLSPVGIYRGWKPKSQQLNGPQTILKIRNNFTGTRLCSKWCPVTPPTATHTDSRALIRSLVFSGSRASSVCGESPEITHSTELLLNKEENWHGRISFKFLGLQSSHNVSVFHIHGQNCAVKVNIYCAMFWRGTKQKSSN